MANRFWVGGGSANTWAATGNTNWAATSGGANNQSVPGVGDVAIFDSNSGPSNSVIGASITVQGLDCTGGTGNYAGTITHNTGVTLTINTGAASSLRFSAGMTYTPASTSSLITFTHTSGTANITSNGQRLFALTINGAGGTTQLLDALLVSFGLNATLTVTSGVFDANTFAITTGIFTLNGATTRSVILGGLVKIGGNVQNGSTVWNAATGGLTFTKNSANIEVVANAFSSCAALSFAGAGLTYNNLTLDATSTQAVMIISGANTFAAFAVNAGWSLQLPTNTTNTVSSAFTWTGTQSSPISVFPSGTSTATLSVPSGACTMAWGALCDIIGTGGATFTATNVFNCGQNTGWSITPPADATTAVPTAAQVATAVWRDVTAGDFTLANSIGKSVLNGVALGTGLTINAYTGNTPQTGDVFARIGALGAGLTAVVAASVTGSVGSVVSYGTLVADTASAVWAAGTRSLTTFGTLVADISTAVWSAVARTITGTVTLAASQPNYAPAVAGDAMALTPSERTATANEVEAQIIDDTDSEKVLLAITNKIAAVNPDLGGLSVGAIASAAATAVWAAVTRTLTAGTNIVLAKGVGVTGFNDPTAAATASAVRTELTTELGRLDVATSTRASQTSVDDLPTNAEFATGLDAADDATLAAIAALPTSDAATIAAAVRDVSNSAPAAGSLGEAVRGADAKAAVLIDTIGAPAGATVSADIAQIIERTDRLPDDPADESLVIAATTAIATAIANVKTDVDAIPTDPATAGGLTAALATIVAAIGGKPSADDILRSVLTEGYAVNGEPMTLEQAVHMIWSMLANKSVTGTTLTTKGLDGATPSGTFTLDKAKNPTSQVRAT